MVPGMLIFTTKHSHRAPRVCPAWNGHPDQSTLGAVSRSEEFQRGRQPLTVLVSANACYGGRFGADRSGGGSPSQGRAQHMDWPLRGIPATGTTIARIPISARNLGTSVRPIISGDLNRASLNATISGGTASGSVVTVPLVLVWEGKGGITRQAGRPAEHSLR